MCSLWKKNGTTRAFLVNCGLLSAIKQPGMVQLIRSNIQNQSFYVENFSQDPDFLFQHFKGVHFVKNDTKRPFMVNCGLLNAIKQPKILQLIRSKTYVWKISFNIQNFDSSSVRVLILAKTRLKGPFWEIVAC